MNANQLSAAIFQDGLGKPRLVYLLLYYFNDAVLCLLTSKKRHFGLDAAIFSSKLNF
jgi:hypothetical protein